MDYGQFLMECVEEFCEELGQFLDEDDEIRWDSLLMTHDELLDDIECMLYIDHDAQKVS